MASEHDLLRQISADVKDVKAQLESSAQQVDSSSHQATRSAVQIDISSIDAAAGLEQMTKTLSGLSDALSAFAKVLDAAGVETKEFQDTVVQGVEAISSLAGAVQTLSTVNVSQLIGGLTKLGSVVFGITGSVTALHGALLGIAALGVIGVAIAVTIFGWQEAQRRLAEIRANVAQRLAVGVPRQSLIQETAQQLGPGRSGVSNVVVAQHLVDEAIRKANVALHEQVRLHLQNEHAVEDYGGTVADTSEIVQIIFDRELKALELQAEAQNWSTKRRIAAYRELRDRHAETEDQKAEVDARITQLRIRGEEEARAAQEAAFQERLAQFQAEAELSGMSIEEQIKGLIKLRDAHAQTTEQRRTLDLMIHRLEEQLSQERLARLLEEAKAEEAANRKRTDQELQDVAFRRSLGQATTQDEIDAIDVVLNAQTSASDAVRERYKRNEDEIRQLKQQRAQLVKQQADEERQRADEGRQRAEQDAQRQKQYDRDLFEYQLMIGQKTLEDKRARIQAELDAMNQGTSEEVAKRTELARINEAIAQRDIDRLLGNTTLTKEQIKEQLQAWLTYYGTLGEAGALAAQRVQRELDRMNAAADKEVKDLTDRLVERFGLLGFFMEDLFRGMADAVGQLVRDLGDLSTSFGEDLLNFVNNLGRQVLAVLTDLITKFIVYTAFMLAFGYPIDLSGFMTFLKFGIAAILTPATSAGGGGGGGGGSGDTLTPFQHGGVVLGKTLGFFEGFEPELVLPLSRARDLGFGDARGLERRLDSLIGLMKQNQRGGVRFSDIRLDREAGLRYGLAFAANGIR